ncbi:MAG: Cache 3/Cache 2 fusion domain-containing protein, partial [Flavobacteriaceae bacterium]
MFSRVSLTWKASALTIALSALTVVALVIASQYVMQQNIAQDVIERQEKNLRIAATMMVRAVPGMEVEWTGEGNVARITVPALPEFGNHDLIDQIGRMTGETATLFVWDEESKDFWRRTTNIKKGDGSRAVGTQLGQGGAVYPVVTRGETFLGEAVILGLPYYTIYEPIFDAAGKVVGILYAGVQKDRLAGRLSEMRVATGIAALAAILLAALSGLWG